jgi:hypothetical protein
MYFHSPVADLAFWGLAYLMTLLHIDPGAEEVSVFTLATS